MALGSPLPSRCSCSRICASRSRNSVASRWTLHGTHRDRHARLRGIVISRFEDGKIVEDWAASDTMELLRQLGIWRSALPLARRGRLLRDHSRR
jgi:hypothetical protein